MRGGLIATGYNKKEESVVFASDGNYVAGAEVEYAYDPSGNVYAAGLMESQIRAAVMAEEILHGVVWG